MKKQMLTKKTRNGGITLIALVITIIVLLILAGVSIATLTGENGILAQAQTTKEKAEKAEITEKVRTDILGVKSGNKGKITESEAKEILEKYGILSGEITEEGATLTTTNGYVILVSEILDGTEIKNSSKTLADLKVGDYVIYDSGTQGELMFRVLYTQSSEYGLQIISHQSVDDVELGSAEGLEEEEVIALIDDLENVAENYLNTTYASDVRCVGTHPLDGADYEFNSDTYKIDLEQMTNNNMSIITTNYWLASITKEAPWTTTYGVQNVTTGGVEEIVSICAITPYGTYAMRTAETRGFRPCITLNENLKVLSGDGKEEKTAYRLGT